MYSILQYTCMYVCTPRRCPTPTPTPLSQMGGGEVCSFSLLLLLASNVDM